MYQIIVTLSIYDFRSLYPSFEQQWTNSLPGSFVTGAQDVPAPGFGAHGSSAAPHHRGYTA